MLPRTQENHNNLLLLKGLQMKSQFVTAALMTTVLLLGIGNSAFAEEVGAPPEAAAVVELDSGNTAWMLTCSALVLMMTAPGLALFYGGLVRKKNILSVMMQCVFLMGMMTILWAICGYSFAFGGSNPYFGGTDYLFMKGILPDGQSGDQAWANELITFVFQGMFFIITPGLICGAFAERMKFNTMCVFSALWGLLVYCPVCHWVWSGSGWLSSTGSFHAYDFAGGTVVHISSGVSALVCAILIGKRLGYGQEPMPPHNLTYTCIGTALLWVGWFGFNAGSAGAADAAAVNAFVATHLAAAAGVIAWSIMEWVKHGHPSLLGACSGAVAGLVCITPAAGAVNPMHGIILGFAAGVVCFFGCTSVKNKFGYDDTLDAFGIHGIGGILGAVLTGVFATEKLGATGGLIETGLISQTMNQVISVVATAALAIVVTFILLKILDATMGLRVAQEEELRGLDVTQHGEEGYIFL